jgi:hypothetical protein
MIIKSGTDRPDNWSCRRRKKLTDKKPPPNSQDGQKPPSESLMDRKSTLSMASPIEKRHQ